MTIDQNTMGALRRPLIVRGACVWAIALFMLFLGGCARAPEPEARRAAALDIAASGQFTSKRIDTGALTLQAFHRGRGPELTVYIEGDGFAWRSSRRPSKDPTPVNPVALRLATLDRGAVVAYLGRSCQYGVEDAACGSDALWTEARFSEQAVAATNAAIDLLKRDAGADRVRIVGFSGGAAMAALVAARRDDVAALVTVAGYLNPTRLNAERGVSPLSGSLDPMLAAPALRVIPQLHYSGGRDRVIPGWVAQSFIDAQKGARCAKLKQVPEVSHSEGWEAIWGREGAMNLACSG